MIVANSSWKGKNFEIKNTTTDGKVLSIPSLGIAYVFVKVMPNSKYEIKLTAKREGGNGIFYCNLYSDKKQDFPQSRVECISNEWREYVVKVYTKNIVTSLPVIFRIWRNDKCTGRIQIKSLKISLLVENKNTKPNEVPIAVETKPSILDDVIEKQTDFTITPCGINPLVKSFEPSREKLLKNNEYIEYYLKDNAPTVLYLPINGVSIKQTGMIDAFRDFGFSLVVFDFVKCFNDDYFKASKILLDLVDYVKPDWIHMQLQFTGIISSSCIRDIKNKYPNTIITNWTGDIRREISPYFIEIGKEIDLSLISSQGQLDLYKKQIGNNVDYWQIGIDPKRFYKKENVANKDGIVFCANNFSSHNFPGQKTREDLINGFAKEFPKDFKLHGSFWSQENVTKVGYYEQNDLYNKSKIVLSASHFNDVLMYFSDRLLISMASGTLTMSYYSEGIEKYFNNGIDLIWFHNIKDGIELAKYYLNNENQAKIIGNNGYKKILNNHTYLCRVKNLAEKLNLQGTKKWEIQN